jgi:hypothetical protein
MSRELSSVSKTLNYICRGLRFEPHAFHLSTLNVEFLATYLTIVAEENHIEIRAISYGVEIETYKRNIMGSNMNLL